MTNAFHFLIGVLFVGVQLLAAELIQNGSFEEAATHWHAEGEADAVSFSHYGPIPDGQQVMHFRNTVWQNTQSVIRENTSYRITFDAASWGTTRLVVELRSASAPDEPGEAIADFTITIPSEKIWAFRGEVPERERGFESYSLEWFCPALPPSPTPEYLVLAISSVEGFAAIDRVSLQVAETAVVPAIPLAGSTADWVGENFPDAQWLGLDDSGIIWQDRRPLALLGRDGDRIWRKEWGDGKFFELHGANATSWSNLDYAPPLIQRCGDTWRLQWQGEEKNPIDLTVEMTMGNGGRDIALRFALDNRSEWDITSLTLPVGWPEPERSQAEFILPAWVGAAAPLNGIAPISMVSPGQLHSQWFGLQDPLGLSWMLRCDDTAYNLKSLHIQSDAKQAVTFRWGHELWLRPGQSYSSDYQTVLQLLPGRDFNQMAALYRDWAVKQPWYVTAEQKLRERPQTANLRQGWSWLRGMPPVKEVGGRQCDTTYDQALAGMQGFREQLGADLLFWYTGWYGPFDSAYPDFLPVAPEMGGDFGEFAAEVQRRAHLVSVHTNSAEWNSGAPSFDKNKMASWRGNYYENSYGDDHSNFVASLPLAKEQWLEVYTQIAEAGISGIYYDVLGHVIAHDDNPAANYRPEELGRCNWTKAKVELWHAYRQAMPDTFFQTEANWEGSIPYLDANSGGATSWMFEEGRRPLPLWQLTYGDTGFFLMLYDGMGQLNAAAGFAVTPLFGAIQQMPQELWSSKAPFWLHQLRRQRLAGELAAQAMLAYHEYWQWRISEWANGIVVVNDGKPRNGRFPSVLGEVRLEQVNAKANGAVTIVTDTGISSDGVEKITVDQREIWRCDNNRIAFTLLPGKLLLFNPDPNPATLQITVPAVSAAPVEIPGGAIVELQF